MTAQWAVRAAPDQAAVEAGASRVPSDKRKGFPVGSPFLLNSISLRGIYTAAQRIRSAHFDGRERPRDRFTFRTVRI